MAQIPDVIDDPIVRACRKLDLEPRFVFDKLAEEFSNQLEVANHWQRKWMSQGFMSLPKYARQKLETLIN